MFLRDKKIMPFLWHNPATSLLVLKVWDLIGLPMLAVFKKKFVMFVKNLFDYRNFQFLSNYDGDLFEIKQGSISAFDFIQ